MLKIQILNIAVGDILEDEGCAYNGKLGTMFNTPNSGKEVNNEEEDNVPILLPFGEGSQIVSSNTPITAASIAEVKFAGIKESLKASNLVISVIK